MRITAWLCLLCFCLPIYAKSSMDVEKRNTEVAVKGGLFSVELPSNPTTGYNWQLLEYDRSLFSLTKSKYLAPKQHAIGSSGVFRLTFVLKRGQSVPKESKMLLVYKRPWEKQPAKKLQLTIVFVDKV